jgi:hypothetical protein
MLDLPDQSVLVGGLDFWHGAKIAGPISEERLQANVAQLLDLPFVQLYAPPVEQDDHKAPAADIGVIPFPLWYLAQVEKTTERNGRTYRTRPLVRHDSLQKGGRWLDENKKLVDVVPVRFVQACPRGHISDINWHGFVGAQKWDQLWLDEGGAGNDFSEIYVRAASSGAARQIADAMVLENRLLGTCGGWMPWLGRGEREPCTQPNRLLTRSASNAYFPQVVSVIHIPDMAAELRNAVDGVWKDHLEYAESADDVDKERRREKVKEALDGLSSADVWREVQRRRGGLPEPPKKLKELEVETLRGQPRHKDGDVADGDFFARARDLKALPPALKDRIDRIVLVHRLREVMAQVGFTRFEAYTADVSGELALGVERARLARDIEWVPAIENRGEGVFIGFSAKAIQDWLDRDAVKRRGKELMDAFDLWKAQRTINKAEFPGVPYYLLHSLSHLLITSVSLTCGYSSSSIRERVYVGPSGYGILLYTGASGAEGTLGGLVEVGRRIEDHIDRALAAGRLCSNDPVCAQHEPDNKYEDRFLHGAACHGCVLIAETSCERYNQYLDRALVVPSLAEPGAAFLQDVGTLL